MLCTKHTSAFARTLFLAATITFANHSFGQKTDAYFDYNWKPCVAVDARFYSTIEKTDSGWFRNDYFISGLKPQMSALFEDSGCKIYNGWSKFYYANGYLESIGRRIHNKNEGVCLSFHSNGMMSDSAEFHDGIPTGLHLRWNRNGVLSDSIAHVNDSMDVHIGWFDNGSIAFAGYTLRGKPTGKWQYFRSDGSLSAFQVYKNGVRQAAQYLNEKHEELSGTSHVNLSANFKGGNAAWQRYLYQQLNWPDGYQFKNGTMAVVVVDLTIDENGKVIDVEVAVPFHPVFDKMALDVVKQSPPWQPAMEFNRRVPSRFRQPVIFRQKED